MELLEILATNTVLNRMLWCVHHRESLTYDSYCIESLASLLHPVSHISEQSDSHVLSKFCVIDIIWFLSTLIILRLWGLVRLGQLSMKQETKTSKIIEALA
jgi:hypothetical protein